MTSTYLPPFFFAFAPPAPFLGAGAPIKSSMLDALLIAVEGLLVAMGGASPPPVGLDRGGGGVPLEGRAGEVPVEETEREND